MIEKFVWASRFLGSRFDLVQAGGGNTSVKDGDELIVKASGLNIGEISRDTGYAVLSLPLIRGALFNLMDSDWEKLSKKELERVGNSILEQSKMRGERPSIETFLHAVFKSYTFHTHPVSLNCFVSSDAGFERLKELYPQAFFADYATPGIELFLAMASFVESAEMSEEPVVVFLKNHGLVVSSSLAEETVELTSNICENLEREAGLSLQSYRSAGDIFNLLYDQFGYLDPVYPVMDSVLVDFVTCHGDRSLIHFCPDVFIYLGADVLWLEDEKMSVESYHRKYGVLPSLFVSNGMAFIRAKNYKKIKETEDMLRFYALVFAGERPYAVNGLERAEIAYLGNWDAEKFRQGV